MKLRRCLPAGLLCRLLLALGAGTWLAAPAVAVVISSGDGSGNTSAPADDPGWANVGTIGSLTGVYIGNRWVLTASHVGAKAIVLQGVTYEPVPNSRVLLETSPGAYADLIAYRIHGVPPLPALVLSDTTPAVDDVVTLIGDGWNRAPGTVYWSNMWQEITPPPPPAHTGYQKSGGRTLRWGRNQVTATGLTLEIMTATTHAFSTTFDESGGVEHESQAVSGDSGGAVFVKRAGEWQLAGILFAQWPWPNQPPDTAVFGQETYAADIAFYYDAIFAAIAPPAVPALPAPAILVLAATLAVVGFGALRGGRGSR